MSTLRVVGYVRCSLAEQADAHSLSTQRHRIMAWCEATGAVLDRFIEDVGVSGTLPLAERPGGAGILELLSVRRPGVDAVVVARLDRIGRDAGETLTLLKRFASGPLGLVSVGDRLDLSTPHGRALAGVTAIFGTLERELIAARTSEALNQLRAHRRSYSRDPYGFVARHGKLVEVEEEQAVIRRIVRSRRRGNSYARIADRLNNDRIAPKRGSKWHSTSVRSVLRTREKFVLVGTDQVVATPA